MLKVLIVEDEEIIRRGLVHTIDWLGMGCHVVASAADGKQGLEMILQHKPDLVLTDIKMPNMTGLEMLESANKQHSFKSVLLTGFSDFEYAKRAIRLKASDYLLKPINEEALQGIVMRISQELEEERRFSKLAEVSKNSPLSELEHWNIYANSEAHPDLYAQRVVQQLMRRYKEKINIDTIADELGVSSSYLSRKFKESFNCSFLDALNRYRVQQSIKLLNEGTYRVYEISELTGFTEYKHFCSVFKKYTGMSPTEFAKNGITAVRIENGSSTGN